MIICKPKVLVPKRQLDPDLAKRIERYARVCYKSEEKMLIKADDKGEFLRGVISRGHESVIEHEKVTVLFIIDRGISHEIVRHRIASYSQESTRYCNYSNNKFGNQITVIDPFFFNEKRHEIWNEACLYAERKYFELLQEGATPQEARSVLPNSLKTEIVVTYNIREWRHFFRLRTSESAHPQMRQVAIPLLQLFQKEIPILFEDIEYDINFPARYYAEIEITDDLFK